jgi:hypothetical protein
MSVDADVKLYLDHVKVVVEQATVKALVALAMQIEGQAKICIVENDQVDTGFMLNSVYTIERSGSGYGAATSAALARNQDARMAPEERLPGDAAAGVIVGAEYAVFQEVRNSFLHRAAEQVARQAGGICEPVYREAVHD